MNAPKMTPPVPLIEAEVYCPFCDYDMRSRFDKACPECGEVVDELAMRRARVPWANRREIGRVQAAWRTFVAVTFGAKKFSRAVSQPVELVDALRFRRVVVAVLWLTIVSTLGLLVMFGVIDLLDEYWFEQLGVVWRVTGGVLIGLLLWAWLHACTGAHSYWFHPKRLARERQNRAVALSYYACAPLLLLPIAAMFGGAGMMVMAAGDNLGVPSAELGGMVVMIVLGGTPLAGGLLGFWAASSTLAARTADRGVIGVGALLMGQPLMCLILGGVFAGVIPAVLAYLVLILTTMS